MSSKDDGPATERAESLQAHEPPDASQTLASGLNSPGGSESGVKNNIIEELRAQLLEAKVDVVWRPSRLSTTFLPLDRLQEILNENSVAALFRALDGMADKPVDEIKAREKLLAILVVCGESQRIGDFIDDGIFDNHLPFYRFHEEIVHNLNEAGKQATQQFPLFRNWDRESQDQFLERQWYVLAPWLDLRIDNISNPPLLQLNENIPLPFINVLGASGIVHDGNRQLGVMERVEIHPSHYSKHNFKVSKKCFHPSSNGVFPNIRFTAKANRRVERIIHDSDFE